MTAQKIGLDKSKLTAAGFKLLPDWRDAVARYVAEAGLKTEKV